MDSKKIQWGKYGGYEGPLWWGEFRYVPPENATFEQKCMAVLSATEGCLDAVNMYDRCIISVGAVQWCEAGMFGVTRMLEFIEKNTGIPITPMVHNINPAVEFKSGVMNRKAFFVNGVQVQPGEMQQRLFLLHSNGKVGTWDEESKEYAKKWVCMFHDLFTNKSAREAQVGYTLSRIGGFVLPDISVDLFNPALTGNWIEAARAGYISFGANLPAVAAKHYRICAGKYGKPVADSPEWVGNLLKELTFGPGIAIYPQRYNKIRPVIEKLFGVDLPDCADDLKAFEEKAGPVCDENINTPIGVQKALMALNYDVGPTGADGLMWSWGTDAITKFQEDHGLIITGYTDEATHAALKKALEEKGICL